MEQQKVDKIKISCDECGRKFDLDDCDGTCPKCGNSVTEEQTIG